MYKPNAKCSKSGEEVKIDDINPVDCLTQLTSVNTSSTMNNCSYVYYKMPSNGDNKCACCGNNESSWEDKTDGYHVAEYGCIMNYDNLTTANCGGYVAPCTDQ